jgi:hypothetical protein
VRRVAASDGKVQSALRLVGRYGIPGADFNGTPTGLSADGRTLVLEQFSATGHVQPTRLVVLSTRPLRIQKRILLSGWATVDAISPSGRWLYLIRYLSPSDPTKYEVRAYDIPNGQLIRQPIVDPHDRGEQMTGFAVSRVMSSGGRWAYTLYGRSSGGPFVHALDTVGVRAVCIDLPSLANADFGSARLELASGTDWLRVVINGVTQAQVNTRTFAVRGGIANPLPAPPRSDAQGDQSGGGSDMPWVVVVLPILILAAVGGALRRRAKPRAT